MSLLLGWLSPGYLVQVAGSLNVYKVALLFMLGVGCFALGLTLYKRPALCLIPIFVVVATMASPDNSGGFLHWLQDQWFFLVALLGGAMHAGRAEQRIKQLEADSAKAQQTREILLELKNDVKWLVESQRGTK